MRLHCMFAGLELMPKTKPTGGLHTTHAVTVESVELDALYELISDGIGKQITPEIHREIFLGSYHKNMFDFF